MTQELNATAIRIAHKHDAHYNNNNSANSRLHEKSNTNSPNNNSNAANSHNKHAHRLEAGQQNNAEPEEAAMKRNFLLLFASKNGVDFSWMVLLNNIKILVFLVLWFVIVLCMAQKQPPTDESRLFTIETHKARTYLIPQQHVGTRIGVLITGPFDENDKVATAGVDAVTINVVSDAESTQELSNNWTLYLKPGDPEHLSSTEQQHVFTISAPLNQTLRLSMTTTKQVTLKLKLDKYVAKHGDGLLAGALILILMYAMIVTELVERTVSSVFCATLAITLLISHDYYVTLTQIMSWMDIETLLLLFSMMVLIALLADSGIFDYCAVYAYQISKGFVWPLLTSLCLFTAVLSAFLDNVTMMMLMAPIIIRLCEALTLDPVLMLTFMVIFSNIGAACTPIGDPPNIIITTNEYIRASGVTFGNFLLHCMPCVTLVMLQTHLLLRFMFRDEEKLKQKSPLEQGLQRIARQTARLSKATSFMDHSLDREYVRRKSVKALMELERRLTSAPEYHTILAELKSTYGIKDKSLLIILSTCFTIVLLLFLLHSVHDLHQLTLGWAALIGVLLALALVHISDFEALLHRVEWSTLIFFASLFIVMEVLVKIGLIGLIGAQVQELILLVDKKYRLLLALMLILWVSALASAFLDNIPVTAMMLPIVISLAKDEDLQLPLHPLVWTLALGACFGGNGTLIAASANVVSAGIANQHGYKFSFTTFFVLGFPIMLSNVVVTSLYLILCHVVFEWHDPPVYD